jgi:alpha-amylase/alpha-mannosidase (GH57 family)
MHQPYYRSAPTGVFQMPWARLHALKDYLDMVQTLSDYPAIHQTFNLVPSLVEQLEIYASGDFVDLYWEYTLRPAEELGPAERAFVAERLCEAAGHPRAQSHPRYQELARKREAHAPSGWDACAQSFSVAELRDLQVWFNLAWFDPRTLAAPPLRGLVERGRDFSEEDKSALAQVQGEILAQVLPAYRRAAREGRVELSTSPYFHPILPLLANSDSARVAAGDTVLPRRRFAHPEDAWEQVESAVAKHEQVFGQRPRGMWCSEQAVGEDVIPLLARAGLEWTISDETVLSRSLWGSATDARTSARRSWPEQVSAAPPALTPDALYAPYRLPRESGEIAIVFRDHTLSDLIGFTYRSWDAKDAAADLLRRLREIAATGRARLVTIALDGENAWEYYHRDGQDFLARLYEGLVTEPALRCVTISEHLEEMPPERQLDWLHTGSWIGGDLRTWSGDPAHNVAWDLLHDARDLVAARRCRPPAIGATRTACPGTAGATQAEAAQADGPNLAGGAPAGGAPADAAWHHILVAEGSDWFWWFGVHHHTELDHVWDLEFRRHLQAAYDALGEPVPARLRLPILDHEDPLRPLPPRGKTRPDIDGRLSDHEGWAVAGRLGREPASTMQPAGADLISEVRFAWDPSQLFLLLLPRDPACFPGLAIDLALTLPDGQPALRVGLVLAAAETQGEAGSATVLHWSPPDSRLECAWGQVAELRLPLSEPFPAEGAGLGLELRIGHDSGTGQVFHSRGLASLGWRER